MDVARADEEEGEEEWTRDAGGSESLDRNEDDVGGEEDALRFSSVSCVGGTQAIPWQMQEKCDAVCVYVDVDFCVLCVFAFVCV